MVSFKHKFVSAKANGSDSTLVKPTDWNDEHNIITTADSVVLGVPPGAGPGQVQELPMSSVFPAGVVLPFAGPTIPAGWLLCDASVRNRVDFPALFAAIGTVYNLGGETSAQFRLPDLRGRVPAGVDGGAGRLPGTVLGTGGGLPTSTTGNIHSTGLASFAIPQIRVLSTSYSMDGPNEIHYLAGGGGDAAGPNHIHSNVLSQGWTDPANTGNQGIAVDGGSAPFNIVQPTLVMNMMIKT